MRMAPQPSAVEYQRRGQSAEQFFKGLIRRNEQLKLIMAILPQKGSGSGYGVHICIACVRMYVVAVAYIIYTICLSIH